MSVSDSTSSDERGATALLVAMTMLLVMGVAAVVIDGGFGFSERRQAQAGVDFGALAALQAATSCSPGPCSIAAAVDSGADEAMIVVGENLPWAVLDWVACTDPTPLAEVSSVTECVSFTENLGKVRVVLPGDDVATTFGRILGVDALTVRAFAEAGSTLNASSNILPFSPLGIPGNELCLFSNQAPQTVPPCDGSTSGFFGYLDLALYGTEAAGTPSTCNNGTTNTRIAINITRGSDHSLVTFDPGPPPDPIIGDFDACPNVEEDVNQVRVEPGSPTGAITDGLINGVSGSINGQPFTAAPGRIVCNLADYSTQCANVRGESLDHTGLWEYLLPGACPGTNTHDEMLTCLNNYDPADGVIFDSDIQYHPRFAAVPVLWPKFGETEAPTGPGDYEIKEFFAVWIETLYFDCNANSCDTIHSPGETFPGGPAPGVPPACPPVLDTTRNCDWSDTSGPDNVEGMLAFALDLDMLPSSVTDFFPSITGQRDYALTR